MEKAGKVVLYTEDLHISFGGIQALNGVSFQLMSDEILGLVGPNGAGKTCLLNCVSGISRPQSGKVVFLDKEITGWQSRKVAELGISRTFQGVELFKGMTTLDNLLLGRHIFVKENLLSAGIFWGWAQKEEAKHRHRVEEIIDFMELERYRYSLVVRLPIGIQKIIGLARALCLEPKVLLLDEVSAGLTRQEKEDVARFLLRIRHQLGIPIMWVEHDMQMIGDLVDRVIVMDQGRIIIEGAPEEVLNKPEVTQIYLGTSTTDTPATVSQK